MLCSRDDVVLLPIPFTELSSRKVRPTVVVGIGSYPGDLFVVPLTSRLAPAEFPLAGWRAACLNVPSGVKAQLATVEEALVIKVVGCLGAADRTTIDAHLLRWLRL